MIFAHRRGRDAEAQKARKIRCIGTPKTTTGSTTSIETIQKHVVFHNTKQRKTTYFSPQMNSNETNQNLRKQKNTLVQRDFKPDENNVMKSSPDELSFITSTFINDGLNSVPAVI